MKSCAHDPNISGQRGTDLGMHRMKDGRMQKIKHHLRASQNSCDLYGGFCNFSYFGDS